MRSVSQVRLYLLHKTYCVMVGEDGMLRYWGQSYGTVLGATAAAMFPDRIDKMVIDGVVDLPEYYEGW